MARINFKDLSPEQVADLSPADKSNYDKWLAKQNLNGVKEDENDENEDKEEDKSEPILIEVEGLKDGINTTLYGTINKGHKKKVAIDFAAQMQNLGELKAYPDHTNELAFLEELEKLK
jgi:hypothetical protein